VRIRVNNPIQATALAGLGMVPVEMPINQTSGAISSGKVDGAMVGPAPLIEFGISRVLSNHYLLSVSAAPLLVVMTRQKFEGLPEQAKQIIRKLSGGWTAERYIETYRAKNDAAVESLKRRSGVYPPALFSQCPPSIRNIRSRNLHRTKRSNASLVSFQA
jgi:TRAP-type transport system periplasmic protein